VGNPAPEPTAFNGVQSNSGTVSAVNQTTNQTLTKDGVQVSVTTTEAVFSSQKGHEGEFIGATTSTTSYTVGKDGLISSVNTSSSSIGYGQARSMIGGGVVDSAIEYTQPSGLALFGAALVSDHHTVVQGGTAAVGLGCAIAEPCGAAVSIGAGIVGAADFAAEKLKWW
jgi:hypothetical protein